MFYVFTFVLCNNNLVTYLLNWTFRPWWTCSTFPAYSVKTQAPSFGCF